MSAATDRRSFLRRAAAVGAAGGAAAFTVRPATASADVYPGNMPFTLQPPPNYTGHVFEVNSPTGESLIAIDEKGRFFQTKTGSGHSTFGWEVDTVPFTSGTG